MTGKHRIFLARPNEQIADLVERAAADVLVIRRTKKGDLLVAVLPDEVGTERSSRELAEHFG
jgi:hypothetical protein